MSRNPVKYSQLLAESLRQRERPDGGDLPRPRLPLAITGVTGVAGYAALA